VHRVTRSAPDELRNERPRLGAGSHPSVERLIVEAAVNNGGIERAAEDPTMKIAHDAVVRDQQGVRTTRVQLDEDPAETVAGGDVWCVRAARGTRDRVSALIESTCSSGRSLIR